MIRKFLYIAVGLILGQSSAIAASPIFQANLSGDQEVPPVVTDASGSVKFRANQSQTQLVVDLSIDNGADILGVAGAHIHCAPAGSNGPVVAFIAGAAAGGFDGDLSLRITMDETNIINDVCGATIAELIQSFISGYAYVNVHSSANPGGEVRGQIHQAGKK